MIVLSRGSGVFLKRSITARVMFFSSKSRMVFLSSPGADWVPWRLSVEGIIEQGPDTGSFDRAGIPVRCTHGNVGGSVQAALGHSDVPKGSWGTEHLRQIVQALRCILRSQGP